MVEDIKTLARPILDVFFSCLFKVYTVSMKFFHKVYACAIQIHRFLIDASQFRSFGVGFFYFLLFCVFLHRGLKGTLV